MYRNRPNVGRRAKTATPTARPAMPATVPSSTIASPAGSGSSPAPPPIAATPIFKLSGAL